MEPAGRSPEGARLRQGLGDEGGLKPLHLGLEALFRKRGTFKSSRFAAKLLPEPVEPKYIPFADFSFLYHRRKS